MNKIPYKMFLDDGTPINQNSPGLLRTLTPVGGAQIREYADVTNAATTGTIEIGTSFNCAVDTATGVWAGRDVAGDCWLEKWTDTGAVKEYWYAPTAAAGVAPAWVLMYKADLLNGISQFDYTKKLATMEAVKASGMVSGSANIVSSSSAIPASYFGGSVALDSATPISPTLPLTTTVPIGARLQFFANNVGITTLTCAGADLIVIKGGAGNAISSIAIGSGDTLTIEKVGDGYWFAVSGSAQLKYANVFGSNLAAAGYQKLPSGLIIQWGVVATSNNGTTTSVTFPIAFPTQISSLATTPYASSGTDFTVRSTNLTSQSVTGFTYNASPASALGIGWIAIGY